MRKNYFLTLITLVAAITAWADIPVGYYQNLEGKREANLKKAAKNIVRKHTVISYGSGTDATWTAFRSTDVKVVDGVEYWWDMYSDELRRVDAGTGGLNIEHAVANSWWGGTKNDAYKDLFHLNPSDATANNRKSNYPLGIVENVTYTNGVTIVGNPVSGTCYDAKYVYEPADCYKGDFARAYFYMFTVYDDISWEVNNSTKNYMFDGSAYPSLRPWAYEMLLEWAAADPVDKKELDRNEAIYKIQGNRNPFIDIPELANYIWGDESTSYFHYAGNTWVDDNDDEITTPNDPDQPTYTPQGNGSEKNPYTVADIINNAANGTGVWTRGYIVGYAAYVADKDFADICHFDNNPPASYTNTNIILADDPNCKDGNLVVPVQLVAGNNLRQELGLGNSPAMLGKQIDLLGEINAYFGVPGIKNAADYKMVDGSEKPDPTTPEDPVTPDDPGTSIGDGSYETPFKAISVIDGSATGSDVWVEGYIVGYIPSSSISSTVFGADGCETRTNIVIAPAADVVNAEMVVPIQIPNKNNFREELTLSDAPENLGKYVAIRGNIEKYFGVPGLKNMSDYEFRNAPSAVTEISENVPVIIRHCPEGISISAEASNIAVYDITGTPVFRTDKAVEGEVINLFKGIYIVTVNGRTIVKVYVN